MADTLVDSNVLLDVFQDDPVWAEWSIAQLESCESSGGLFINPVIYSEVSIGYDRIEDLEATLGRAGIRYRSIPREALFLAGKALIRHRRSGGAGGTPLPDFYIGAHATIEGLTLLTRDRARYRTYFPSVRLLCP